MFVRMESSGEGGVGRIKLVVTQGRLVRKEEKETTRKAAREICLVWAEGASRPLSLVTVHSFSPNLTVLRNPLERPGP